MKFLENFDFESNLLYSSIFSYLNFLLENKGLDSIALYLI